MRKTKVALNIALLLMLTKIRFTILKEEDLPLLHYFLLKSQEEPTMMNNQLHCRKVSNSTT